MTTTITAKSAYMVEMEGIDSSRILALTFSKEAARNMREKANNLEYKTFINSKMNKLIQK